MTIRFAKKSEIDTWNTRVLTNPDNGNVFQGYEFALQKKLGGWTPRFVLADDLAITLVEKKVFGFGKVWYIPKGPGISSVRQLDELLQPLKKFARSHGVFTIKIEPELPKDDETLTNLMKLGLVRTRSIQPNSSTVILDISADLDTVLSNLNQKARHAINRAKRDGVTTKAVPATDENCRIMFDLLHETATDAEFGIRPARYYGKFYQTYEKADLGQLFFAYFEGKVVAGAYALAFGVKGTYKDGASVRQRSAYGASHLLQWEVLQWMKTKAITSYDLCGTPPSDQINNPDHSYYGIGRFKTSFNKHVTDYVGAYEIPVRPKASRLWTRFFEKVVRRIYYKVKGESYY
jgi:lipid II:glycine glycyltransferase (peptidoglycan interpeptide bridge formation enzyme)